MSRRTLFVTTLSVGVVLAVVGLALAAPIGATEGPQGSNPRMDFAPALFVLGIILTLASAAAYELVRDS